MKVDDNVKNQLIGKYRTELFETDDIDINELNDLISDEEIKMMIQINNTEMCELINKKEIDKTTLKRLLIVNINLYKLAKSRKVSVHGSSFLMTMAGAAGYDVDKLYAELNVGMYNRPFKRR